MVTKKVEEVCQVRLGVQNSTETLKTRPVHPMTQPPPAKAGDTTLLRIIAVSTALAFAAMLGTAACVDGHGSHGLVFRWRWAALVWMAFGAAAGWTLWQAVWAADASATARRRRRVMLYLAIVALGGIAVFAFPITFVPAGKFGEVFTGLVAALIVLSFVGWMVVLLGKLFASSDSQDSRGDSLNKNP